MGRGFAAIAAAGPAHWRLGVAAIQLPCYSTVMQSGLLKTRGSNLYYETEGDGPAVVLIPGFTLDTRMWADQAAAFRPHYRVIRYDLPGAGRSPPPAGSYAHEEDLADLLDHLDVDKAHVMGLSLGGAIAIDFALAYPERVLSLVPVDTSALNGYPWHDTLSQWFSAIGKAANDGDMARAKALWLETGWFGPAMLQPAVAARLREIAADYSGWHFHNKNPLRRPSPPANDRLAEITTPTLVVTGELDLAFYNHPIAERLASTIPNARRLTIPHVGHMASMEAPEVFNDIVLGFLASVENHR